MKKGYAASSFCVKFGADAYVAKPFDMGELLARTEALLRRTTGAHRRAFHFGSIRVDLSAASVTLDGVPIRLPAQEFRLLSYLVKYSGVSLSREQILRDVLGYDGNAMTRTSDVHVANLRQKLEVDPKRPALIRTVQRRGYKFEIV